MQFACGKCATRYAVPDERVAGKRVRTQCRKCGADIVIEGPYPAPETVRGAAAAQVAAFVESAPPSARAPLSRPPPSSRDESPWTVAVTPDDRRQMTTAEVVQAYGSGLVTEETLIWKDGMEAWSPPFEVPSVALALRARGYSPGWVPSLTPPPGEGSPEGTLDGDPRRELTRGPVPDEAFQDDDDEETHVVAEREPRDRSTAITQRPPPGAPGSSPYGALGFQFENETTAVIAPDRAKELLQAEALRDAALAKKPSGLDFIFDDEATAVIAPERATELLRSDPEAASPPRPPGGEQRVTSPPPKPPRLTPYPPSSQTNSLPPPKPPKLTPYPSARPGAAEPSVVVAESRRRPDLDALTTTLPPKVARDLVGIQHEKTRLVRTVQRSRGGAGGSFWLVLTLALAAAATGGFLASQMIQRHGAPAWLKGK